MVYKRMEDEVDIGVGASDAMEAVGADALATFPFGPGAVNGRVALSESGVAMAVAGEEEKALLDQGQEFADRLRALFGLDFVAVSVAPGRPGASFSWQVASGNTSDRYRRIFLPEGVGVLGYVAAGKRALVVEDAMRDIPKYSWYQFPVVAAEGLGSLFAFPLLTDDAERRLVYIVLAAFRQAGKVDAGLLKGVQELAASETGLALPVGEPVVFKEETAPVRHAETAHRILQAQEDERKRIARELHDGLAQELLLVQIELRRAKYLGPDEQPAAIERASEQLKGVLAHISSIAQNLRPPALDELGLAAAVSAECRDLERTFGLRVDDSGVCALKDLNPDVEVALYRVFQEASSNACKYSLSERLRVALFADDEGVHLVVQDFGRGFDVGHPQVRGGGLGLAGMRERAAAIGGTVDVSSKEGEGTTVSVLMPRG